MGKHYIFEKTFEIISNHAIDCNLSSKIYKIFQETSRFIVSSWISNYLLKILQLLYSTFSFFAPARSARYWHFEFFRLFRCTEFFEFLRHFPRTRGLWDFTVFPCARKNFPVSLTATLSIYDFPCTRRIWVWSNTFSVLWLFSGTGVEFERKIPCIVIFPGPAKKSLYQDFSRCWRIWAWARKFPILERYGAKETLVL